MKVRYRCLPRPQLVIVNISDHYNRTRLRVHGHPADPDGNARVMGVVLGTHKGRVVELTNSFELVVRVAPEGGALSIDVEHLNTRREQYKEVFPELHVVGWYTSGTRVHDGATEVQATLGDLCENPLLLVMDPLPRPGAKELPVTLYEPEMHVVDGEASSRLSPAPFTLKASEAERIAVDEVSKLTSASGSKSGTRHIAAHLDQMGRAVQMLHSQLSEVVAYLRAVEEGKAEADHSILRSAETLSRLLPDISGSNGFRREIVDEASDALVPVYLAALTKGTQQLQDLLSRVRFAYDKMGSSSGRGVARGGMGMAMGFSPSAWDR